MVTILKVLPLAFVMIAGPQILTAILLATSENWFRNSAAFLTGAALSITIVRLDRLFRQQWRSE